MVAASHRGVLIACLAMSALLLGTGKLRASRLPDDLDSLVFQSDQIVEGRIVPPDRTDWWAVKVLRVLAGSFRAGQRIHPENLFQHEVLEVGCSTKGQRPLLAGDRVVLFMTDEPKFECVPAGMFLLVHGSACRFGMAPPMDVTGWEPPRLTRQSPTLGDLAEGISERLHLAARWHALINAPLDGDHVQMLLQEMRRWTPPSPGYYSPDEIYDIAVSSAIAQRLASLKDPAVAYAAMDTTPYAFNTVFQTRRGREFLLRHVTDRTVPTERRLELAWIMGEIGGVYSSDWAQAATRPWVDGTAPDPNNSHYLTRIAEVAVATAKDNQQVSLAVLKALGRLTNRGYSSEPPDPEILADLDGARDVLTRFYEGHRASGELSYEIEQVLAGIDPDAYLALHSTCGLISNLVRPLDTKDFAVPPEPCVALEFQADCVPPWVNGKRPPFPALTAANLVLTAKEGVHKQYVLPASQIDIRQPASESGIFVPLPPGFRRGIYEVHVQLVNGNAVVSEGHGFEAELPQRLSLRPRPSAWIVVSYRLSAMWDKWGGRIEGSAAALIGILLLRRWLRSRRRVARFQTGRCPHCGYDLRASGARCSECGAAITESLRIQVFRRRSVRFIALTLIGTCFAVVFVWVRSYHVADVMTRTTFGRADTVYATCGMGVVQWLTVGNELGWVHQVQNPTDVPRTAEELGSWTARRVLGLEYSDSAHAVFVPLWMLMLTMALISVGLLRAAKPVSIRRTENPMN